MPFTAVPCWTSTAWSPGRAEARRASPLRCGWSSSAAEKGVARKEEKAARLPARVRAAGCWPRCRVLLRSPCSRQGIAAAGILASSLAILPVAVLVSQRRVRASLEQKCSFHLWLRSLFSLPSLYFFVFSYRSPLISCFTKENFIAKLLNTLARNFLKIMFISMYFSPVCSFHWLTSWSTIEYERSRWFLPWHTILGDCHCPPKQ